MKQKLTFPTIEERNATFSKLDAKGKRIALAQDVINLLNAELMTAHGGTYVHRPYRSDLNEFQVHELIESNNLKDANITTSCNVCAMGALLMAEVFNTNNLQLQDLGSSIESQLNLIGDRLGDIFEDKQLRLIEAAFEDTYAASYSALKESQGVYRDDAYWERYDEWIELRDNAKAAYADYEDQRDRMIAIMQNVIDNDGTFVVP